MLSPVAGIAVRMFRYSALALAVFVALGLIGTATTPPLAQRADSVALAWQWLVFSSVAAGGLTGLVAVIAGVIAAVSRRAHPRV